MIYQITNLIISIIATALLSLALFKKRDNIKRNTLLIFFLTFFIIQIICCIFWIIYLINSDLPVLFHFRNFLAEFVGLFSLLFHIRTPNLDLLIASILFGLSASLIISSSYLLFKITRPKIKIKSLALILLAISPLIISVIVHPVSLIKGSPVGFKDCCEHAAYNPPRPPRPEAVNFFTATQEIGSTTCILLTLALLFYFIKRFQEHKKDKTKALDLYTILLLIGQSIVFAFWVAAISTYNWEGYLGLNLNIVAYDTRSPLPFLFYMGFEKTYFLNFALPIISIIMLIYCNRLLSKKTIKTGTNK